MRNYLALLITSIGLTLGGCGDISQNERSEIQETNTSEAEVSDTQAEKAHETEMTDNLSADTTGAAMVFHQYDADAPKGELDYGEDFVIEVLKNGKWEEAPIPVEGNYDKYMVYAHFISN